MVQTPLIVPSLRVFVQVCPRKGHSRVFRVFCAARDWSLGLYPKSSVMLLAMRCFLQGRRNGSMRFKVSAYLQGDGSGHQNGNGVADLLVLGYAGTEKSIRIGERLKACCFTHGK